MKIDREYRLPRMPRRGWVELRHYSAPCPEYPLYDVVVEMNWRSGECVTVIYGLFGTIHTIACLHPYFWGVPCEEEWSIMARFVRQQVAANVARQRQLSALGQQWADSHPAIWEYLTLDTTDDGKERVTSMLCVFVEQGCVKVALQDRHEGLSLWVSSQSIPEALEALETRLQSGDGEWRQSRGSQGAKKGPNRR